MSELGITLPPPGEPKANYNMSCLDGRTLYVSGHLPITIDDGIICGRCGEGNLTKDEGYVAARWAGLNLISTLKRELGDLDRVEKVVKLFGIVNSTPEFIEQHLVMNGCSDLMIEVFGHDVGYHARSAIGTSALPLGTAVEVEGIVKIKP